MADFDVKPLLPQFKLTIGDLKPSSDLDDYYLNFLTMAAAGVRKDDISDEVLQTELGNSYIVLYADALINKRDVATDPTLILLRNTLSVQTKGMRYADGD